jgi:hypothetical protein
VPAVVGVTAVVVDDPPVVLVDGAVVLVDVAGGDVVVVDEDDELPHAANPRATAPRASAAQRRPVGGVRGAVPCCEGAEVVGVFTPPSSSLGQPLTRIIGFRGRRRPDHRNG